MRIKAGAVAWSPVGDELVGLDLGRSEYVTANDTASVVIQRLSAEGATTDELADELVARFRVDRPTAVAGVDRLVAELRARDLLED